MYKIGAVRRDFEIRQELNGFCLWLLCCAGYTCPEKICGSTKLGCCNIITRRIIHGTKMSSIAIAHAGVTECGAAILLVLFRCDRDFS